MSHITHGGPLRRAGSDAMSGGTERPPTDGGAAMQAVKLAQAAGCEVVLVICLVERHEGGGARFREIGVPFRRLFYTHEDGSLHVDEDLALQVAATASAGTR